LPPESMILYCLCSYGFARSETNVCCLTFRSLIAQILRKNRDLLPHVYDNFVRIGATPSVGKTRELLKSLLGAVPSTFMVLDGLEAVVDRIVEPSASGPKQET
jgi:hypothetical protein